MPTFFLILVYCSERHGESYFEACLLFHKVFLDFFWDGLVADVPLGVVIASVGASVDHWLPILGGWWVGETQLDLGEGVITFSSFCS